MTTFGVRTGDVPAQVRLPPYNELFERSVEDAARTFGVQVSRTPVHDDAEITAVFERLSGQSDAALLVPSDAFTYFRSATIVALAAKNRLPAVYAFRRFATEGGLVAYGVDAFDQVRSTASYVDRILKRCQARRPSGADAE